MKPLWKASNTPSSPSAMELGEHERAQDDGLFAQLLKQSAPPQTMDPGIAVGQLVAIKDDGLLTVAFADGREVSAMAFCRIEPADLGRLCAVANAPSGTAQGTIVLGLMQQSGQVELDANAQQVRIDQALTLDCPEGIHLRCGPASLTLSPDGRIELRGVTVVTHADDLHRIKAGSVRIN